MLVACIRSRMRTVYAKHEPYTTGHLADVVAEMRDRGAPTIRVVQRGPIFYALEGSHRLAAAHYLGLEPKIVVEIEEAGETLDAFWDRVAPTLPRYDFEHIHTLELKRFNLA